MEEISNSTKENCAICENERWVCENHPNIAWPGMTGKEECCGGAGMPCVCNPLRQVDELHRNNQ